MLVHVGGVNRCTGFTEWSAETWALSNRVTPHDWFQLVSAVLEHGPQLQWKSYWREKAKSLEQQGRVKRFEASQDRILGEGQDKIFHNRIFISLGNVEVPLIFSTYTTVCEVYYYIRGIEIF